MLHTKYQALDLWFQTRRLEKFLFRKSSPFDLDMQRTETTKSKIQQIGVPRSGDFVARQCNTLVNVYVDLVVFTLIAGTL